MNTTRRTWQAVSVCAGLATVALSVAMMPGTSAQGRGQGRGQAITRSLSDPLVTDPIIRGAIDLHAHQDPDSYGPSYGQAARSLDAIDLVKRAKAAGMRGFVIKMHLDQTAGLAYYVRTLYPEMEIFGGTPDFRNLSEFAIRFWKSCLIRNGWARIVGSEPSSNVAPA